MSDKSALERSWDENAKLRQKVDLLADTGKVLLDRIALLEKACEAAVIVANGTYSLRDDVCDLKEALRATGHLQEPAP